MKKEHILMNKLKNGRSITRVAIFLFLIAVSIGSWGTYQTHKSIRKQQGMEEKRVFYKELGDNLEHATDYMNKEVQAFAVTGEMSHFFNYWTEADITRTREDVLEEMEKAGAPEQELNYLRRAKEISDRLMETEISAIQLVLHSRGISEDSYDSRSSLDTWVTQVLSYPMDEELAALPVERMQSKAISMLFDKQYLGYKNTIITLIDGCNSRMNERLDQEVRKSRTDTVRATVYQILFIFLAFTILGGILLSFQRLFIIPVQQYTGEIQKQIQKQNLRRNDGILKVTPSGSDEMVQFGEEFNQMSESFHQEMESRKKAEQMMAKAKAEADKANQFKSVFLAQFSHEIRTPLNAVSGYTWMLQQTELNRNQRMYAENIHLASKNLLQVINHILDYSKIEAGKMLLKMEEFSLRQIIIELYSVLEYETLNKGLAFKVNMDENIPDVLKGDGVRLYQVLQNLVYNGIKFTDQGEICMTITCKGENQWGYGIHFSVKDTGCGIAKEQQKKIFEPYSQTSGIISNGINGTGLGLSICQEIVRLASDGRYQIQLESEVGKGSCFSFQMDFQTAVQMPKVDQETECEIKGIKILLVEDNPVNLILEEKILGQLGYEVDTLEHPNIAEELVRTQNYDLILLDIGMPDIDGYELAARLRKIPSAKEIPILALTAYRKQDIKNHPLAKEFNDYLSKPIDPIKLKEKIEQNVKKSGAVFANKNRIENQKLTEMRKKPQNREEGICYVNFDKIEKLLDYNIEAEKELLMIFLQDKKETEDTILDYIENRNYDKVHNQIHSLKGVSANLFCEPLIRECAAVLTEMEEKSISKEDLNSLFRVFRITRKLIENKEKELEDRIKQESEKKGIHT